MVAAVTIANLDGAFPASDGLQDSGLGLMAYHSQHHKPSGEEARTARRDFPEGAHEAR